MKIHPNDMQLIRERKTPLIGKSGADPFSMEYSRVHAYKIGQRFIVVPFNYDKKVFYFGEAEYVDETELPGLVELYEQGVT